MVQTAQVQDMAEQISKLCKSCHNRPNNNDVHEGVHGVTAQKSTSVHEGVHLPHQECPWRCPHYYILLYNTLVGL